jgi:xylulose-5-phosphate/fructose-6-phosphate phosphoketolase
VIRNQDLNVIYVCGPVTAPRDGGEHVPGGDLLRAVPAYYPGRGRDGRLFRQFSFPGGIPSHAAPETPGSIHEGGELGYSLVHGYGAAY